MFNRQLTAINGEHKALTENLIQLLTASLYGTIYSPGSEYSPS